MKGVIGCGGRGVSVEVGMGEALEVAFMLGVRLEVGARTEAEEGRNTLNKQETTMAAQSSRSRMPKRYQRVSKFDSDSPKPITSV